MEQISNLLQDVISSIITVHDKNYLDSFSGVGESSFLTTNISGLDVFELIGFMVVIEVLDFPSKAAVGRIMPKEAFYKRLVLSSDLRNKFVSDIKRITMEYKLSPDTLNVENTGQVSEILVLSIELKK